MVRCKNKAFTLEIYVTGGKRRMLLSELLTDKKTMMGEEETIF